MRVRPNLTAFPVGWLSPCGIYRKVHANSWESAVLLLVLGNKGFPCVAFRFLLATDFTVDCLVVTNQARYSAQRQGDEGCDRVKVLEFPIRPYQAQLPVFMVPE